MQCLCNSLHTSLPTMYAQYTLLVLVFVGNRQASVNRSASVSITSQSNQISCLKRVQSDSEFRVYVDCIAVSNRDSLSRAQSFVRVRFGWLILPTKVHFRTRCTRRYPFSLFNLATFYGAKFRCELRDSSNETFSNVQTRSSRCYR